LKKGLLLQMMLAISSGLLKPRVLATVLKQIALNSFLLVYRHACAWRNWRYIGSDAFYGGCGGPDAAEGEYAKPQPTVN
jgi:hypothetical protein